VSPSTKLAPRGGAPGRNPLIAKLETVAALDEDDRRAIHDICGDTRDIPAGRDIIRQGDRPESVHLILDGWAARYKVVPNGGRQITAYLIPGDFCDIHVTILREMDHGIIALTPATVAFIPHEAMEQLPLRRPALARALWWATLVDEAVLRAWIVNLGRRDAYERVGHLMCEMHIRMRNVGLVEDGQFSLPLTQEEIADTLGLTPVHTNRVIQRLRREGLITLKERMLAIPDVAALRSASGFDPSYLHARHDVGNGRF
jgi:CRP-like cAMP-binding protein